MTYRRVTISNAPLRKRALELVSNGESWSDIAARAGYSRLHSSRKRIVADGLRVQRELGIAPYHRGAHCASEKIGYRKSNTVAVAKRLCQALGVDPVDIGI